MKFKIADKILYRVPQFPIDATLKECWDKLKESIALSSVDFHKEIADTHYEDWQTLPSKSRQTILKYYNRSKYRPVPFGTFAAVGLIAPKPNDFSKTILLEGNQIAKSFTDWPFKAQVTYLFEDVVEQDCFLFSNSTYYVISGVIRYIYKNEDGFELADLESDQDVLRILKCCSKQIRLSELINKHSMHFEEKERYLLLIKELILEQLLFTSKDANIIGDDYFERIGFTTQNAVTSYVIANREYISGTIDKKLLKHLPSLTDLLLRLSEPPKLTQNLKVFKEQFVARFDKMVVPIMQVLDPEIGLGYAQLESAGSTNVSITDFLPINLNRPGKDNPVWKISLSRQLATGSVPHCIYLDQLLNIDEIPVNTYKVANIVSALLQVVDECIVLDHLGGYSTNQFAGRFSLANKEIYNYCRETAAFEQASNPDILFFDVAYTSEVKVDNVNRRRQIYDYQLSILNYDTSSDPITLDDLMVSVINDEVILRSKSLNKRLVPRLATAYNHGRSDLPVYRFLCDLNVQGLITNLSFNIAEIQPDRSFYPRVQYHNIIVSPAMWRVSYSEYQQQKERDGNGIKSFISTKGIPRHIKLGVSDQTLLLDLEAEEDGALLESQIKKTGNLLIEEVFLPMDSIVRDSNGSPFLAQMLVSLQHDDKIYNHYSLNEQHLGNVDRLFVPGSEWLYFELYCHPQRADQILQKLYFGLILKHPVQIKKWFFIRYNENGEHLRIRLLLLDPVQAGVIMKLIYDMLIIEFNSGIVSDMQIKTYKRELERYGEPLIEDIETHFYEDSRFIISLLAMEINDVEKYQLATSFFDLVLNSNLIHEDELLTWISSIYTAFTKEHGLTIPSFKKMNKFIRELEITISNTKESSMQPCPTLTNSMKKLLYNCLPEQRLRLFTDLLHMHINRMFSQHQRTHEMVLYAMVQSMMKRNRALAIQSLL